MNSDSEWELSLLIQIQFSHKLNITNNENKEKVEAPHLWES